MRIRTWVGQKLTWSQRICQLLFLSGGRRKGWNQEAGPARSFDLRTHLASEDRQGELPISRQQHSQSFHREQRRDNLRCVPTSAPSSSQRSRNGSFSSTRFPARRASGCRTQIGTRSQRDF